jgi:hypothetical protein
MSRGAEYLNRVHAAARGDGLAPYRGESPHEDGTRLQAARLADVEPEAVSWLWPGRLPLGKVVLLEGDPGLGKSTVALDLAARVTAGRRWPDKGACAPAAPVVILSAEDGPADTIRPRFDAAGGDPNLAVVITGVTGLPGGLVSLPDHVELLREHVRALGARLVLVDPLTAYLAGHVNSHRDHDVRRALAPLAALAHDTGALVLVIRHLNKSIGGPAIYRGGGSIGIAGAARAVFVVAADPGDASRRVLAPVKSNLATLSPSLTFTLDDVGGVARVSWGAPSPLTAAQLLAAQSGDDDERSALDAACELVRDVLADRPVSARDLERHAREAGVSRRTLERARARLGVRSIPAGFGGPRMLALSGLRQNLQSPPNGVVGGDWGSLAETDTPVTSYGPRVPAEGPEEAERRALQEGM